MTKPRNISGWLPTLLGPVDLQANGEDWPSRRQIWNFVGDITVTDVPNDDDPTLSFTQITIGGGGGSGTGFGPTIANSSTGTLNNIASTSGSDDAGAIRFTGVAPTVTGIVGGADKRRLVLIARGGPLVLANQSSSSVAANRIVTGTGADVTIKNNGAALLAYDPTSARWQVVGIASLPGDAGEVLLSNGNGGATALAINNGGSDEGKVVRVASGVAALAAVAEVPAGSSGDAVVLDGAGGLSNGGPLPSVTAGTNVTVTPLAGNVYQVAASGGASITGADKSVVFLDGANTPGVDPGFVYDKTSNFISVDGGINTGGGTYSTGAFWNTPYATTQTLIATKNSGGTNITVLQRLGSGFTYRFGDQDNLNVDVYSSILQLFGKSTAEILAGSSATSVFYSDGTVAKIGVPVAGNSASSIPFRWKTASVSCASVSSLTLTAAQYQCPTITFTGTPTTDCTVTAPLYDGEWHNIRNKCGGGAAIIFQGATGTGPTIANAKNAPVTCDGTNWERMGPDATP